MQGYRISVRVAKSRVQQGRFSAAASVRRWVQPVSLRDVVQPSRRPVGQTVFIGEFPELGQLVQNGAGRVVRVLDEQLAELPEIVLEPARSDDLDDAAGLAAGVPHRVHLAAWFGDVATRTEDYFTVIGAEADLARLHDRDPDLIRIGHLTYLPI